MQETFENEKNIINRIKKHFNQPVIANLEVGRLIGFAKDNIDCYYIVKYLHGKKIYHSCVGGYMRLTHLKKQDIVVSYSGKIWNNYNRLDNILELNGCEKEKEFILEILEDVY